jgi:NAD(P)-dependent dehydrogenase (short-subunit alcohol dehydrogenase family)
MDLVLPTETNKIYITGTTRGLGKWLKYRYEKQHFLQEVVGLNRPEHDLSKTINNFIKKDFSIYIINAHYEWSQTDLLYALFDANKNRDCQIVVIGSVSADGDRKEVNKYAIQKKALDAAVTQLQLVQSKCLITQIKLGRMDTDMVKHIKSNKMDPGDVARRIFEIVEMNSRKDHYIKTVTIDVKE